LPPEGIRPAAIPAYPYVLLLWERSTHHGRPEIFHNFKGSLAMSMVNFKGNEPYIKIMYVLEVLYESNQDKIYYELEGLIQVLERGHKYKDHLVPERQAGQKVKINPRTE
jgi:hypothetical protein